MTPHELLAELCRRNVRLTVDGANLKWAGPSEGGMDRYLIPEVKTHKDRLIEILAGVDPRPDRQADSRLWTALLRAASTDAHDVHGLYGVLIGLRSWGATLSLQDGRLRMSSGEMDDDDYVRFRHDLLLPRRDELSALLAAIAITAAA